MKNYLLPISLLCSMLFCACGDNDKFLNSTAEEVHATDGAEAPTEAPSPDSAVQPQEQLPQSGQMTAAEWNDLANWDFWKNLDQNEEFRLAKTTWNFNPFARYEVNVTNDRQKPVINATVMLVDEQGNAVWTSKTDHQGRAQLWGFEQTEARSIIAKYQGMESTLGAPKLIDEGINQLSVGKATILPTTVDVQFVVDATGSMSDEISFLQAELTNVMQRVADENSNMVYRVGSVFYRDHGDEYVTKSTPFSTDIAAASDFVKLQHANGGGDFPEAVSDALQDAIHQQSWNEESLKIMFLILDAPPHGEPQKVAQIQQLIADASSKGIRIIPVTASGIDKSTEFLMRRMSTATNGTYVFITNDSGIGNDHLEATVGPHDIEFLNDLLTRLIIDFSTPTSAA